MGFYEWPIMLVLYPEGLIPRDIWLLKGLTNSLFNIHLNVASYSPWVLQQKALALKQCTQSLYILAKQGIHLILQWKVTCKSWFKYVRPIWTSGHGLLCHLSATEIARLLLMHRGNPNTHLLSSSCLQL